MLRGSLRVLREHLDAAEGLVDAGEIRRALEGAIQIFDAVDVDADRVLRVLEGVRLLATEGRSGWDRMARGNQAMGWPDHYVGVSMPDRFARALNRLLLLIEEGPRPPNALDFPEHSETGTRLRLLAGEDVPLAIRWRYLPEVEERENAKHAPPCSAVRTSGRADCDCEGVGSDG